MATLIQYLQSVLTDKEESLPNDVKRIILKESLQAHVLDFLYNHPLYRRMNFYGGTCLHVVYQLNRLSEDIDLDNSGKVDLSTLSDDLVQHFSSMQSDMTITAHQQEGQSGILRTTLRFPVLYTLGLSSHESENLHLKIEVSPHRQVAVIQHTPVFYYNRSFVPAHFSLETMMAGKMIACIERSFADGTEQTIKGRDFYDLLWFMQQDVLPLAEKIAKDGDRSYSIESAMNILRDKVNTISRRTLANDLLPLFESRAFIDSWLDAFHENFKRFSQPYIN